MADRDRWDVVVIGAELNSATRASIKGNFGF